MPVAGAADVGLKPAGVGRWGALDLGGNVGEALLDSTWPSSVGACNDCALYDPSSADAVFMGGAWSGQAQAMFNVYSGTPLTKTAGTTAVGVRCAYDR